MRVSPKSSSRTTMMREAARPKPPPAPKVSKIPDHTSTGPPGKVGRPPLTPEERGERESRRNNLLPTRPHQIDPSTALQLAVMRVKYRTNYGAARLAEQIIARLPQPHEMQARAELSPAKRKVIVAGRRGGKTTGAARVAIIKMCEGRRVLLASTTQDQADAFWEKCKQWLAPFIESGEIEKNENKRTLVFLATGGRIKAKTASDADTLRGDHADFLVLDECALLAPDAWDKVGAPLLVDNNGDCWFLSTPRHRNWFYSLYLKASSGDSDRWEAFHFSSFANPYLDQTALQEIGEDLSEEAYRQEIMAEFLEGEGAVFRDIRSNLTAPLPAYPEAHQGHLVVMGVDWAMKRDYTVLCCFCATCQCEVELIRFNQIEWAVQRDRLVSAHQRWRIPPSCIWAEENTIGNPNIEALQTYHGISVQAFKTSMQSKGQIIRGLSLALERHSARWQDIPVATAELEAYEAKVSRATGNVTYQAPDGVHDDTVMGRALALHAARMGLAPVSPMAQSYADISVTEEAGEQWVMARPYPTSPATYVVGGMRLPGLNYGNR